MKLYYEYRHNKDNIDYKPFKRIIKPTLLCGDNIQTLNKIQDKEVQLIFTSPPYYNAREYADYKSYKDYLNKYERMYRPLELTSTYTDTYDYYKNPWPWDNDGGIKYV